MVKNFFAYGQRNASSDYFLTKDHLGSVREITNNAGAPQSQYVFDAFGRILILSEAVPTDFSFAWFYNHKRSNLNLSFTRPYSASLARWINRDRIGEAGGNNLFAYVENDPISFTDPEGTQTSILLPPWKDPCRGLCPDGTKPIFIQRNAYHGYEKLWVCRGDKIITMGSGSNPDGSPAYQSDVDNEYRRQRGESEQASQERQEQDRKKFENLGKEVENVDAELQRRQKEREAAEHKKWHDSLPSWLKWLP